MSQTAKCLCTQEIPVRPQCHRHPEGQTLDQNALRPTRPAQASFPRPEIHSLLEGWSVPCSLVTQRLCGTCLSSVGQASRTLLSYAVSSGALSALPTLLRAWEDSMKCLAQNRHSVHFHSLRRPFDYSQPSSSKRSLMSLVEAERAECV